jgi:uncharacterized protein involved in propanediol utilization
MTTEHKNDPRSKLALGISQLIQETKDVSTIDIAAICHAVAFECLMQSHRDGEIRRLMDSIEAIQAKENGEVH